jgi:glycerate dehydrogenase
MPLNDQTKNLFTLSTFRLMKPSAYIINAGRGGIINENDLVEAINKELIAGAGLDVFEKEPMSPESPILKITHPEKIILTPHIAWTSVEARNYLIEKISKNIVEFQSVTV